MNCRRLFITFMTLMLGALLSYGFYRIFQSRTSSPARLDTDVVIAAHDLQMGTRIEDGDVKVVKLQPDVLPVGCIHDKAMVVGRGVVLPMAKGDFVLPSHLAAEDGDPLISPGMRAVSVQVNESVGALDFRQPGAQVDVLEIRVPSGGGKQLTTTLLKNVSVIAVGQAPDRNSAHGRQIVPVATLLVSPDDAQKLTAASLHGRILLSMLKAAGTK